MSDYDDLYDIPTASEEFYALTAGAGAGYLAAIDAPKLCSSNAAALAKTFEATLNLYDGATGTLLEDDPDRYDPHVGYRCELAYPVCVTLRVEFGVVDGIAEVGVHAVAGADQGDIVGALITHFRELYDHWVEVIRRHPKYS